MYALGFVCMCIQSDVCVVVWYSRAFMFMFGLVFIYSVHSDHTYVCVGLCVYMSSV